MPDRLLGSPEQYLEHFNLLTKQTMYRHETELEAILEELGYAYRSVASWEYVIEIPPIDKREFSRQQAYEELERLEREVKKFAIVEFPEYKSAKRRHDFNLMGLAKAIDDIVSMIQSGVGGQLVQGEIEHLTVVKSHSSLLDQFKKNFEKNGLNELAVSVSSLKTELEYICNSITKTEAIKNGDMANVLAKLTRCSNFLVESFEKFQLEFKEVVARLRQEKLRGADTSVGILLTQSGLANSLKRLLELSISRLQTIPGLLRAYEWDSVETLSVTKTNELAENIFCKPIFQITKDKPNWSWPNLPDVHQAHEIHVDCLNVYDPEGNLFKVKKLNGEFLGDQPTAVANVIFHLKGWLDSLNELSKKIAVKKESVKSKPHTRLEVQPNVLRVDEEWIPFIGGKKTKERLTNFFGEMIDTQDYCTMCEYKLKTEIIQNQDPRVINLLDISGPSSAGSRISKEWFN